MSSLMERKTPQIPPVKMMDRKVLSLGMKLGLSYVNYKDKLLGEQVAYVIDDMLNAVEQGKNTIESKKYIYFRVEDSKLGFEKKKIARMDGKKTLIRKRKEEKRKKRRTREAEKGNYRKKVKIARGNKRREVKKEAKETFSGKKEEVRHVEIPC